MHGYGDILNIILNITSCSNITYKENGIITLKRSRGSTKKSSTNKITKMKSSDQTRALVSAVNFNTHSMLFSR
jgi:hypothetical protein